MNAIIISDSNIVLTSYFSQQIPKLKCGFECYASIFQNVTPSSLVKKLGISDKIVE